MSENTLHIGVNGPVVDVLKKHSIRVEELFVLLCFSQSRMELLNMYLEGKNPDQRLVYMQSLVRKQFMTYESEQYHMTVLGQQVCSDIIPRMAPTQSLQELLGIATPIIQEERTEFDVFVEKYLDMFPKGVRNGGNKPLRGNFSDTKAKMFKFMNKYKQDKETILAATKNYLARMNGTFTYCPTSEYFILKDGYSALASECDLMKNSGNSDELINPFEKRM